MKLRDSVDVTVPLEIPRADEPPVHAKGDDMITTQYELNGRIEVSTPIGIRRVVLRQLGDVRFDSAGSPERLDGAQRPPLQARAVGAFPGRASSRGCSWTPCSARSRPSVGTPGRRNGI